MTWGPWTGHDGKNCPRYGMEVQIQRFDGTTSHGRVGETLSREEIEAHPHSAWVWDQPDPQCVFRYRIRRPDGLALLESIVANPRRELEKSE